MSTALEPSLAAGPIEVVGGLHLSQFEPIEPEQIDRSLSTVTSATCMLDTCPTWHIKTEWEGIYNWVWVVVNTSL